jgi:predicted nucleic acid-binding protein
VIILDINVISEPMRPAPSPRIISWLDAQNEADLWLTAITAAELRAGVARLPDGRRRRALENTIAATLEEDFAGRILPFDADAATQYAAIVARQAQSGRMIEPLDIQIAAIARLHGSAVATRNVSHFEDCGVEIVDPWEG